MPETGTAPAKMCVVCGQNVADKPRVKDAAGRYMCKPCAEKQTAAKPATALRPAVGPPSGSTKPAPKADKGAIPLSPEPGYDSVMASLVASSKQVTSVSCPNCKGWVKEGQLLCTSCGFNLEEGKQIRTRIQKEKAVREPRAARKPLIGGEVSPVVMGVVMLLLGCGLALGAMNKDLLPFVLIPWLISQIAIWIAILIQAAKEGIGMLAILIVTQFIPIVGPAVYLYFVLVKCESETVKYAWIGGFIGSVIGFVVLFSSSPDFAKALRERSVVDRGRTVLVPR